MGLFRAVLFDLDDTLYPERAFVESGFAAVARWLGTTHGVDAGECEAQLLHLFDAAVRGSTFDTWLERAGLPRTMVPGMIAVYRSHFPSIRLHDDASPVVEQCRADGLRLGLLSDGYADTQRNKIAALGIRGWFDTVMLTDELGREYWKPSPRPFALALERIGVDSHAALYVGDNPHKDFAGARAAGLRSIRVRRTGGVYADIEAPSASHEPDLEISALTDLQGAMAALVLRQRLENE